MHGGSILNRMGMKKKMLYIGQKIDAIQFGLLRFRNKKGRMALEVKTKVNDESSLLCFIEEKTDLRKLVNKKVSVVQHSGDDYLYITGQVEENTKKIANTISVRILKACWFVRKTKGELSWLQEKYIYDIYAQDNQLELAS